MRRLLIVALCGLSAAGPASSSGEDKDPGADRRVKKAIEEGQDYLLGAEREKAVEKEQEIRRKLEPIQKEMAELVRKKRTQDARYRKLVEEQRELSLKLSGSRDNYRDRAVHLETYALIASGISRDDKRLKKRLETIRERIRDGENRTYDLALSILALTEGLPAERYGKKDKEVELAVKRLVEGQTSEGGWSYECSSQYKSGGHGGDLSNIQFAVLGLGAAHQKGYSVPETTWERVKEGFEKWFIADASKAGGAQPKEDEGGKKKRKKKTYLKTPGGWGYSPNAQGMPTGSMTCAGICSLILSTAAVRGKPLEEIDPLDPPQIEPALRYLDEVDLPKLFEEKDQPGFSGHFYYHLYSIERTGSFCRLDKIGDHDWYREGARLLLDRQESDGGWSAGYEGATVSTSFALLFLSRATLQTFVKRAYHVGGLDEPAKPPPSGPLGEDVVIPGNAPPAPAPGEGTPKKPETQEPEAKEKTGG